MTCHRLCYLDCLSGCYDLSVSGVIWRDRLSLLVGEILVPGDLFLGRQ